MARAPRSALLIGIMRRFDVELGGKEKTPGAG